MSLSIYGGKQPPNTASLPGNDGKADDAFPPAPADAAVGWSQPHTFAILLDSGLEGPPNTPAPERWDAGAVNAVAAIGRTAVVGARNSGVWLINPEFSAAPQVRNFPAQALSYGWEHTTITALEWGPMRAREPSLGSLSLLFVATTSKDQDQALFALEFRTRLGGLDHVDTTAIVRHAEMGSIEGLVYLEAVRVLVAATSSGVWWTRVPPDPKNVSTYHWERCIDGLQDSEFSCVSRIRDAQTIAVGGVTRERLTNKIQRAAIYCGVWTGSGFSFEAAALPTDVQLQGCRIACCDADRSVAYAVSTDEQNSGIGAVLRSSTGGTSWIRTTIPAGKFDHGDYNMCIAVHPASADTVVLGWNKGLFVSTDAGAKWELRPAPHADQHALVFAEQAQGEFGLFLGSDGGVGYSGDLGVSWDTRYNKHLLNLEIYAPNHARPAYIDITPFDVSTAVEGLIACATQDNGNLWCALDDLADSTVPPWDAFRRADGGDGATSVLLADGSALWCIAAISGPDTIRTSKFKHSAPRFFETGSSTVPIGSTGEGIGNPAAVSRLRVPGVERSGAMPYAVAGKNHSVYMLWRHSGELGQFEEIAQIAGAVRSVASYDGSEILAGTNDGRVFLCNVSTGGKAEQPVDDENAGRAITRLLWAQDDVRFALNREGRILRWDGERWRMLVNGPQRNVYGLEYVPRFAGGVLFTSTMYGVLSSQDHGETWVRNSDGLPRRTFGTNLKWERSGGRDYLYLSTYGWGVFRADVTARRPVRIRIPRRDLIRRLLPIIEERAGIEIRDGDIVRVDHRPEAYQLAVATLISSLAQEVFPHARGSSLDLQKAAYELEQQLARPRR